MPTPTQHLSIFISEPRTIPTSNLLALLANPPTRGKIRHLIRFRDLHRTWTLLWLCGADHHCKGSTRNTLAPSDADANSNGGTQPRTCFKTGPRIGREYTLSQSELCTSWTSAGYDCSILNEEFPDAPKHWTNTPQTRSNIKSSQTHHMAHVIGEDVHSTKWLNLNNQVTESGFQSDRKLTEFLAEFCHFFCHFSVTLLACHQHNYM